MTAEEPVARSGQAWEIPAALLTLFYFALRLGYFALRIDPAIPPDEVDHFGLSMVHATALLLPMDSEQTYPFGVVADQPYLYYWLMGKLVHLNIFGLSDLVFLRLCNAGLAVLTAVYAYRWIAVVTGNPIVRVLFLVMFTNTLLATAVGASVSYDNLANLLAVAALYYLFACSRSGGLADVAAFLLCLLAGALTKRSFLPLAAILFIVWLVRERSSLKALPLHVGSSLRPPPWRPLVLWILTALFALATAELYAGNLIRYRTPIPDGAQVLGFEKAIQYRMFLAHYVQDAYHSGEMDYGEAVSLAQKIRNPVDRIDTLNRLKRMRSGSSARMGRWEYLGRWSQRVVSHLGSYVGHRQLRKSEAALYPFFALLAVAGILFVLRWSPRGVGAHMNYAAAIALAYAAVLIWLVNYPMYLKFGTFGFALQGRYLLPVLAPLYAVVAHSVVGQLPQKLQAPVAVAIAAYFVYGDLPYFAMQPASRWFLVDGY